jgi:dihydroorotate dehydrogenase
MSRFHDEATRVLRALDPELAHRATIAGLSAGFGPNVQADRWPRLAMRLAGLALPNPLGLAAGFDKNAEAPDAMLGAGFGFVEVGTITPRPQAGNPKPRLFRLPEDRAIINRMGFNNGGLDAGVARLYRRRARGGIVGVNVGANKDTADRVGDYVEGLRRVWSVASYVTINISSPNTPGLRGLQERGALEDLLGRIGAAKVGLVAAYGSKPVFLKVAPDLDDVAIADIAELVIAHGVDGLIVSNTTIARSDTLTSAARAEAGGLSGAPLFQPSTEVLRRFHAALAGRVPLIGVGGVASGADALAKIRAGASAVQLYTALVYEGPGLIERILSDLSARLAAEGFANLDEAIGA